MQREHALRLVEPVESTAVQLNRDLIAEPVAYADLLDTVRAKYRLQLNEFCAWLGARAMGAGHGPYTLLTETTAGDAH